VTAGSLRWPTHVCGAGNSTTDYATLVFSVALPWPTSHMWSWQQHHGLRHRLFYADFQRCSALVDVPHVELATAPRIMRHWFSASLRLGRRPTCGAGNSTTDYTMDYATLVSASLRLGRHLTCGAGNSTTDYTMDYATLVFGVAPPWPTLNTCGAGSSTMDYATLVFSVALPWPMPNTCGAGNSTTDYATLVFSVALPWLTSHMWSWQQHHGLCSASFQCCSALADVPHMWSWLHEILVICSPTRSSDWQCSGLHYAHSSSQGNIEDLSTTKLGYSSIC
jgi:hypothetical protein